MLYGYERTRAERAGEDAYRNRCYSKHHEHERNRFDSDSSEAWCDGWRQEERREEERQEQEAHEAACERRRYEEAQYQRQCEEAEWEQQHQEQQEQEAEEEQPDVS